MICMYVMHKGFQTRQAKDAFWPSNSIRLHMYCVLDGAEPAARTSLKKHISYLSSDVSLSRKCFNFF